MKELVVISGKGGTGKTSVVASFAALAGRVVNADCDVDAADLHLLLGPKVIERTPFSGGKLASIDPVACTGCGRCEELCRFGAVSYSGERDVMLAASNIGMAQRGAFPGSRVIYSIDKIACEGCGVCAYFCPAGAIAFEDEENGEWYVSETRFGPMVHARLRAGSENSGKLVTIVRNEAKRVADENGIELVLVDGSPGIGCPVIASLTGADLVLVVTEPTMSGVHDMERVVKLVQYFGIETMIAVNKYDINGGISSAIEDFARRENIALAGRIRYDRSVTEAQIKGKTITEFSGSPVADDIKRLWNMVLFRMNGRENEQGI